MKKRFFALFLTMALLLPAVLLSGCASADSGIMDTANLNATAAGGDSSLPVRLCQPGHRGVRRRLGGLLVRQGHGL